GRPTLRHLTSHQGVAWVIRTARVVFPSCPNISGRVPVLVQLRPSSEGLLRPRAPGAQDRHGRPSNSSRSARCAMREHGGLAWPPRSFHPSSPDPSPFVTRGHLPSLAQQSHAVASCLSPENKHGDP